ncbi:hypothetical protein M2360_003142, partial [Rhizobium sp. SG_E_25_P2]|uniref:hypothetical protein n=1 Tax=Rhizobium sp. SG_E_25_P2 TaxID=2879942 RepID=UPI0024764D41
MDGLDAALPDTLSLELAKSDFGQDRKRAPLRAGRRILKRAAFQPPVRLLTNPWPHPGVCDSLGHVEETRSRTNGSR